MRGKDVPRVSSCFDGLSRSRARGARLAASTRVMEMERRRNDFGPALERHALWRDIGLFFCQIDPHSIERGCHAGVRIHNTWGVPETMLKGVCSCAYKFC